MYDAFNALKSSDGTNIDYWDVGFMNVWNNTANDFAKGEIEKIFSNLDEGESIGNPAFSKNSPDILAFDYLNENTNTYEVVAIDLSTGKGNIVYENNDLGFPSYSRLDNRLVFKTGTDANPSVRIINLNADKISASGNATLLYAGKTWPVWYTQGTRTIPAKAAQTISFDAITDRYINQGGFLTLKATSSSNLAVNFQVKSGPAILNGTILKFNGIGSVTIQALQSGNDQFTAATAVERTFNVLAVLGDEPLWSDALSVYPNPVSKTLTVELPATETIETISIRTLSGMMVIQPTVRARQHSATLDVGHLPKGLYLLQVQTANGTANRKVIKEE